MLIWKHMRAMNGIILFSSIFISTCSGLVVPQAVVHTACGFIAGSAGAVAAYPIDYVKSQLQTESGRAKYSGGLEAAFDIVKEDGVLALYRGVMVNVIGIAPEKTIKLSVNDAARVAISNQMGYLPIAGEVAAGAFAGMMQVIVTNPLEVIKVKLQTSDMSVREVLSEFKSLGDVYQGAEACVARDMIFSGVLFPLYAHAKVAIAALLVATFGHGGTDAGNLEFWVNMLAGSLAAAPAAVIATPPDVVKTRMQQARRRQKVAFPDPVLTSQEKPISAVAVLNKLVKDEGVGVLFSGCAERVVRSAPQFGVTLAVFDVLNSIALEHGWLLST